MLTWSLSGALWLLVAGGGDGPAVPILTAAPPRAAAATSRGAAASQLLSARAATMTRFSAAPRSAALRTSFTLVSDSGPRYVSAMSGDRYAVTEVLQSGASASVRALRLEPPRRRGAGGPLDTRLTLTLTGDRRSLDADLGVKGGVASAVRYALEH